MHNESVSEFAERQGNDCINAGGYLLIFANGAMMENVRWGRLWEPPDDARELAKIKVRYAEAHFRRAVSAFRERQQEVHAHASVSARTGEGGPSQDDVDQIKALRREVLLKRNLLRQAQRVSDEFEAPEADRRAKSRADHEARMNDIMNEVENLRI